VLGNLANLDKRRIAIYSTFAPPEVFLWAGFFYGRIMPPAVCRSGKKPFVAKERVIACLRGYTIEMIRVIQFGRDSEVPQADKPDF
jgi:hypothetical protein